MRIPTIAATLLLSLALASAANAYDKPELLNQVARHYSLGVGEVRCASEVEWESDPFAMFRWGYTDVRQDFAVLAPHVCDGALNVERTDVPAWERAVGTLVLVHEAFHLRHWRYRRDEANVECQAIVYFTEAAQKLGATEAEANDLFPYALAWHWRQEQLLSWYRDPGCLVPPWIPPSP